MKAEKETQPFWYIESSSQEMCSEASAIDIVNVVIEESEVLIERRESEDSEDDNLPIAQTRLRNKVTAV